MDDKTMLELAAKAAGIEIAGWLNSSDATALTDGGVWEPLYDDGDALRLAINLGLEITSTKGANVYVQRRSDAFAGENTQHDPYAATRRAITRAAAAIGEKM